ncbi:hypothetical protein CEUSTIGMA_g1834.t1 [Chlamydomonas eustigma]|uniref:MYND-type domain-containing protein n=1 Tax=Chlamydomonas eustigma TaxID=1157962 RepID=A0A250WUG0_9CHLO|nr:hypothetical protein CEUSTIGMA_g1834.t1 [Chlamydomonas eustigma]|eukprot:GAX74386.1 hypothetical protein CEUSTIGMA_g1834.t1 [Chlamydomonas eustigma]
MSIHADSSTTSFKRHSRLILKALVKASSCTINHGLRRGYETAVVGGYAVQPQLFMALGDLIKVIVDRDVQPGSQIKVWLADGGLLILLYCAQIIGKRVNECIDGLLSGMPKDGLTLSMVNNCIAKRNRMMDHYLQFVRCCAMCFHIGAGLWLLPLLPQGSSHQLSYDSPTYAANSPQTFSSSSMHLLMNVLQSEVCIQTLQSIYTAAKRSIENGNRVLNCEAIRGIHCAHTLLLRLRKDEHTSSSSPQEAGLKEGLQRLITVLQPHLMACWPSLKHSLLMSFRAVRESNQLSAVSAAPATAIRQGAAMSTANKSNVTRTGYNDLKETEHELHLLTVTGVLGVLLVVNWKIPQKVKDFFINVLDCVVVALDIVEVLEVSCHLDEKGSSQQCTATADDDVLEVVIGGGHSEANQKIQKQVMGMALNILRSYPMRLTAASKLPFNNLETWNRQFLRLLSKFEAVLRGLCRKFAAAVAAFNHKCMPSESSESSCGETQPREDKSGALRRIMLLDSLEMTSRLSEIHESMYTVGKALHNVFAVSNQWVENEGLSLVPNYTLAAKKANLQIATPSESTSSSSLLRNVVTAAATTAATARPLHNVAVVDGDDEDNNDIFSRSSISTSSPSVLTASTTDDCNNVTSCRISHTTGGPHSSTLNPKRGGNRNLTALVHQQISLILSLCKATQQVSSNIPPELNIVLLCEKNADLIDYLDLIMEQAYSCIVTALHDAQKHESFLQSSRLACQVVDYTFQQLIHFCSNTNIIAQHAKAIHISILPHISSLLSFAAGKEEPAALINLAGKEEPALLNLAGKEEPALLNLAVLSQLWNMSGSEDRRGECHHDGSPLDTADLLCCQNPACGNLSGNVDLQIKTFACYGRGFRSQGRDDALGCRTRYCSRKCQSQDWKAGHKDVCGYYESRGNADNED